MYLGEINHRGVSYKSDHPPIIDLDLFEAVQAKLLANLNRADLRKSKTDAALTGCIFDDRGNPMSPSHVIKKGVRYRYYVSTAAIQGRKAEAGSVARAPAKEVEALVIDAMRACHPAIAMGEGCDLNELFRQSQLRVRVGAEELEITWAQASNDPDDDERRTLRVPWTYNPHKRRREIVLPEGSSAYIRPIESEEQATLIEAISKARRFLLEIVGGATIRSVAQREGKSERMIRMLLTLAFLDPKLVRAVLQGALPRGVSMRRLIDAPSLWYDQWQALGLTRPL